jgi:glycosyltransferase involved in cell wall biosynthesis
MPGLDLLCLSSSTEGFPNVIGEAMACGVPCVTTDAGDAGNIVEKTGWVVPTRNPKALAEALSNALNLSPIERGQLGNAGRTRIKSNFSLRAVIEQYATLYDTITQESNLCPPTGKCQSSGVRA